MRIIKSRVNEKNTGSRITRKKIICKLENKEIKDEKQKTENRILDVIIGFLATQK